MEKLNKEYVGIMTGDESASKKFWPLRNELTRTKERQVCSLMLKNSEVAWDFVALMRDEAITEMDLEGFNKELKEYVIDRAGYQFD